MVVTRRQARTAKVAVASTQRVKEKTHVDAKPKAKAKAGKAKSKGKGKVTGKVKGKTTGKAYSKATAGKAISETDCGDQAVVRAEQTPAIHTDSELEHNTPFDTRVHKEGENTSDMVMGGSVKRCEDLETENVHVDYAVRPSPKRRIVDDTSIPVEASSMPDNTVRDWIVNPSMSNVSNEIGCDTSRVAIDSGLLDGCTYLSTEPTVDELANVTDYTESIEMAIEMFSKKTLRETSISQTEREKPDLPRHITLPPEPPLPKDAPPPDVLLRQARSSGWDRPTKLERHSPKPSERQVPRLSSTSSPLSLSPVSLPPVPPMLKKASGDTEENLLTSLIGVAPPSQPADVSIYEQVMAGTVDTRESSGPNGRVVIKTEKRSPCLPLPKQQVSTSSSSSRSPPKDRIDYGSQKCAVRTPPESSPRAVCSSVDPYSPPLDPVVTEADFGPSISSMFRHRKQPIQRCTRELSSAISTERSPTSVAAPNAAQTEAPPQTSATAICAPDICDNETNPSVCHGTDAKQIQTHYSSSKTDANANVPVRGTLDVSVDFPFLGVVEEEAVPIDLSAVLVRSEPLIRPATSAETDVIRAPTKPMINIPDNAKAKQVNHPWYDPTIGMVDAFSAFAHVDALKAAAREQRTAERVRQRLLEQSKHDKDVIRTEDQMKLLDARSRSVMVTNLPPDVTAAQITRLFHELSTGLSYEEWKEKGTMKCVVDGLLSDAISRITIVRGAEEDGEDHLCIGYCHVEFESPEHVESVLKLVDETDGARLLPPKLSSDVAMKRVVKIISDKSITRAPLELYQIYLGGIPKNLSYNSVLNRLKFYLKDTDLADCVHNIELVQNRSKNQSMGYAFVRVHKDRLERLLDVYKYVYTMAYEELVANEKNVEPLCNPILPPRKELVKYGHWCYEDGTPIYLRRTYQKPLSCGVSQVQSIQSISNSSLFLSSVPVHVTETDIREMIEPFGEICSLRLLHLKRLCFINMTDTLHAYAALSHLNGTFLKGYRVEIMYGSSVGYEAHHVRKEVVLNHSDKFDEKLCEKLIVNSLIPVEIEETTKEEEVEEEVDMNKVLSDLASGSLFAPLFDEPKQEK